MIHTAKFIPGHELSRLLFEEIVQPLLSRQFPNVPYAATMLGAGSDVLGFDTARSMDHDWAPRLNLLLSEHDVHRWKPELLRVLDTALPPTFHGIPVDLAGSAQIPGDAPVLHHHASRHRPHGVNIDSVNHQLRDHLGIGEPTELDAAVWLTTPQQSLLELTSGPVFHDETGDFTRLREMLAWYPDDLWKHLMAAQWMRISQLEAFVGRTGEVADDTGSQLVTMRIVADAMRLAFLQERRYAPYEKWFGSAFSRLAIAAQLQPGIDQVRFARTWQDREAGLNALLTILAEQHNRLHLTPVVDPAPRQFFDRPFRVLFAERFSRALREAIDDPVVQRLPDKIGNIDQFIDATDARRDHRLWAVLRRWFRDADRGIVDDR
jgi:hypothetical protein